LPPHGVTRFMISVIIPTFNEADNIPILVSYLKGHSNNEPIEIIICDGNSTDETIKRAKRAGATAIISPQKGRAAQMNYGASVASGSILYFVHADSFPPPGYTLDIIAAVNEGYDIGRYRTKFNSSKTILKINAWFTRFDWFVCYGGDQTLFITKPLFNKIGGFAEEMLIMEDYDIVKRAKKIGRYKIFDKATLVSARKYDLNSWFKVQQANKTIVNMYRNGATQEEMVKKYREMLVYR
jgi:rSAM/selenodomain-associated transferase 2